MKWLSLKCAQHCANSLYVILYFSLWQYYGRTPLHFASERGYKDVAELLLSTGAGVNEKDQVSSIYENIASTATRSFSLFTVRTKHCSLVTLYFPLCSKVGRTPLHWASEKGYKNLAELLISKGADVKSRMHVRKCCVELSPQLPLRPK